MFSRYVGPLLRRLTGNGAMLNDTSLDGFTVILEWLKETPMSGGRPCTRRSPCSSDKATALEYLAGDGEAAGPRPTRTGLTAGTVRRPLGRRAWPRGTTISSPPTRSRTTSSPPASPASTLNRAGTGLTVPAQRPPQQSSQPRERDRPPRHAGDREPSAPRTRRRPPAWSATSASLDRRRPAPGSRGAVAVGGESRRGARAERRHRSPPAARGAAPPPASRLLPGTRPATSHVPRRAGAHGGFSSTRPPRTITPATAGTGFA